VSNYTKSKLRVDDSTEVTIEGAYACMATPLQTVDPIHEGGPLCVAHVTGICLTAYPHLGDGQENARRLAALWNQTLYLSTEAIERGEFLHVAAVEAWSSLSLTAFSAWLAALERKQPHRDIEAGSLSRIATLLSAAQRALEQTPVVPLPTSEEAGV
jgi:hypothetical protein